MRKFDSFSLLVAIICSLFFFILGVGLTASTSFESSIGDLATWVASIGTVSTLGFAIRQNRILREEQKLDRKEREEHENKQRQMWDEQLSMLKLEQYEKHFSQFTAVLNELKFDHGNVYRFKKTTELYRKIFPAHTLIDGVDLSRKPVHHLNLIRETLLDLKYLSDSAEKYHPDSYEGTVKIYLSNMSLLVASYIGLDYLKSDNIGDVTDINAISNGPHKVLNVFSTEVEHHLCEILDRLSRFANEDIDSVMGSLFRSGAIQKQIVRFAINHPRSSFETYFGNKYAEVTLISECRDVLSSYGILTPVFFIDSQLSRILGAQKDNSEMAEALEDKQLVGMLSDCHAALTHLIDDDSTKARRMELASRILILINEYGYPEPIDSFIVRTPE